MKVAARIVFYSHVFLALHCTLAAILDGRGLLPSWMFSNAGGSYGLIGSAVVFPAAAMAWAVPAGCKHPLLLLFSHLLLSAVQIASLLMLVR